MRRTGFKRLTLTEAKERLRAKRAGKKPQSRFGLSQKPLKRGKRTLRAKPDRALAKWSRQVRERDDYTCQRCGIRDENNIAHHRAPRSTRPDLRLDTANGVTLCNPCHSEVHASPISSRAAGWLADESYEKARRAA